jgi:predicted aconitase
MKQRGHISFSRTTTGSYLMKITDSKGNDVAEVEMSAVEFAASITGSQSKCDLITFTKE